MNAELDHYGVADRIVPGAHVLDLGASTGQFARPALLEGASVLAVEPRAENCERLEAIARTIPQLRVLRAAVGSSFGLASLAAPADPAARETGCYTTEPAADLPLVPVVAIDELVTLRAEWDVVKVDIEGAEYRAFAGASERALRHVRCFTIDTHRWTVADEPRLAGIGHREHGPMYPSRGFEQLAVWLSETHRVEALGGARWEAGVTLLALRR